MLGSFDQFLVVFPRFVFSVRGEDAGSRKWTTDKLVRETEFHAYFGDITIKCYPCIGINEEIADVAGRGFKRFPGMESDHDSSMDFTGLGSGAMRRAVIGDRSVAARDFPVHQGPFCARLVMTPGRRHDFTHA